jgi:hypothetical protein
VSQAHIEAATKLADSDLLGWLELCRPGPPPPQNVSAQEINPLAALIGEKSATEPMKVFDNRHQMGLRMGNPNI